MAKHSSHILDMARKGAGHRYEELKAEIAALVKNFPHLASKARKTASKVAARISREAEHETTRVRGRSRKMSAKARKAVSERMKKFWAARRKTKNT